MNWFVQRNSVVRKIWGQPDMILFIFAGAAAEFALNKAVDWLYFTGRLPADPLGRLFSTVTYARHIVFSSEDDANKVIDKMADIHHVVEENRGSRIPAWAYRDVLYMLIDYSIRAYELLEKRLDANDKEEVYHVFMRVGRRMKIPDLPENHDVWLKQRDQHMKEDLAVSKYTHDLYAQYKKHLGVIRYHILLSAQGMIVPAIVNKHLGLGNPILFRAAVAGYKGLTKLKLDWYLKALILPRKYIGQIKALETSG
jgi:hypothetical protein